MLNSLEQNRIAQEELPNDAYTLINLGFNASYQGFNFDFAVKNIFNTIYTDHLSRLKTLFDDISIHNIKII